MKKRIVLISLMILIATLLVAFMPFTNRPVQSLQGSLQWTRASTCDLSDYVHVQAMNNVFLSGNGFPTLGQFRGCMLRAHGIYYQLGGCTAFDVRDFQLTCSSAIPTQ